MTWVALIAALFGITLTAVNVSKTLSDWTNARRTKRIEKKQSEFEQQIAAWRGIVEDLGEQIDRVDKRLAAAEERLQACEDERDRMYHQYVLKDQTVGEIGGT